VKYTPKSIEAMQLRPKHAIGHIVGNFLILGLAGNGRVNAKCLLCNNENYSTQFYKIKSDWTTSCSCKHNLKNPERYIGKKYGKLTIKEVVKEKCNGAIQVKCDCDCGNETIRVLNVILRGKVNSCGCLGNRRNGLTTGIYKKQFDIWRQMLSRCHKAGGHVTNDPNLQFLNGDKEHARYCDYGNRGITVCKEWMDLAKFIKWHTANIKPGESMDRIDNSIGYNPSNVRSADDSQQSRNQRIRKDSPTLYKGVMKTPAGYGWTVRHNKEQSKCQRYRTMEQALLERNIYIIVNDLPHDIQVPVYRYKLVIGKHELDKNFYIGIYNESTDLTYCSVTRWNRKNHPTLTNIYKRMQQAYINKYKLAK